MRLRNQGGAWSADLTYAPTSPWSLSPGDGLKTVEVLFADAAGNWMTSPASDQIVVDQDYPEYDRIAVDLTCLPSVATLPFTASFSLSLANADPYCSRQAAGRLDLCAADGSLYSGWRQGYLNLSPGEAWTRSWNQAIPAMAKLVGLNVFRLAVQDVTPSPYNQPPYPPAGETDIDDCTMTAQAP
jgi:hypothetical protein